MRTLSGKLLNGSGEAVGSGLVLDDDGLIVEILPLVSEEEEPDGWIIPGMIDIHCHGGGGASFPDSTDPQDARKAINTHRVRGTTGMVASLVSMLDPIEHIKMLAGLCEAGELLGIHLEGPYISPCKVGAQNPAAVRVPDLDELRSWLEAGAGHITTMTIAPETENAIGAAKLLLDFGAIPSWGHTNASGAQTRNVLEQTSAYAREIGYVGPAQTATHLFNAMPPLAHREPGPVRELLASARHGETVIELVADTVHISPDLVHDVIDFVGSTPEGDHSIAFVTDAMAGAGMPDGQYVLGSLGVVIQDSVARLAEGGAIAGGTSHLTDQIKRMVQMGNVRLDDAVRACVAGPARAIGLSGAEPGVTLDFEIGRRPNVVVLDDDLDLIEVIREGTPVGSGE